MNETTQEAEETSHRKIFAKRIFFNSLFFKNILQPRRVVLMQKHLANIKNQQKKSDQEQVELMKLVRYLILLNAFLATREKIPSRSPDGYKFEHQKSDFS